ncbi:hypothetical protein SUGI_0306630 [Cryptomeria japonica]|uniref:uncharacterized protein LOC131063312 n=1 Tax=Cryptomeria japonica TaxID=3369 RepID=UPI002408B59B|nr:uncharacterized protein LOC131063312 [Cryptomeria japonica]GLJ17609.1 hypothetical protein SUGI_0306630 [Cryptomeria japonica]
MNIILRAVSVVATTATVVSAFLTYKSIIEHIALEEQYGILRDTAAKMYETSKYPATILVFGFENHGRSSFVNTVFRVLFKENGPLVMRAETGPCKRTTTTTRIFRLKNQLSTYPKYLVNLIETPTFWEYDVLDEQKLRKNLRGENAAALMQMGVPPPECVVIVIRADASCVGGSASESLPDLAKIIREEGLQFVVVLTHKKEAKTTMDLQELMKQVAQMVGTDCVQCIDNYIAEHSSEGQNVVNVNNNFSTHIQTLSIMKQCFEYVKQRRQLNKKRSMGTQKSESLTSSEDFQSCIYHSDVE